MEGFFDVTPGRIVFFKDNSDISPAIITRVHTTDCVNLVVFNDGSTRPGAATSQRTNVLHEDDPLASATYCWFAPTGLPPRLPAVAA